MKFYQSVKFKMSLMYSLSVFVVCMLYWGLFYTLLNVYTGELPQPASFPLPTIMEEPIDSDGFRYAPEYDELNDNGGMSVDEFDEVTDEYYKVSSTDITDMDEDGILPPPDDDNEKGVLDYYSEMFYIIEKIIPLVSFLIALFMSVFSFAAGYLLSRVFFKPVNDILLDMKEVSIENLTGRVSGEQRKDEFGELARNYNRMLDRVKKGYQDQRQFMQDASHELKTPLTTVQANLDIIQTSDKLSDKEVIEGLKAIESAIRRMSLLVKDLLILGRKKLTKYKSDIDLADVTGEVISASISLAECRSIEIKWTRPEDKYLYKADRELIYRMINNIVVNSIQYGKKNGWIKISLNPLKKEARDDCFVLEVEDNGIGIKKKDVPMIWDRFYRSDDSRDCYPGGSGLGLSIVKKIADFYGIKIEVESKTGEGTKFCLSFYPGTG